MAWEYRISVVNGSSWPCSAERVFVEFWREALSRWPRPVLLEREDTHEILLAARRGKLMTPGQVFDLCLDKMEFAAKTEREHPGVYSFPPSTIKAMLKTIQKLDKLKMSGKQ